MINVFELHGGGFLLQELASRLEGSRTPTVSPSRPPLLLFGVFLFFLGGTLLFLASAVEFTSLVFGGRLAPAALGPNVLLLGGFSIISGAILCLFDLFVLLPRKRHGDFVKFDEVQNPMLTVVLTAYNDELSIRESVLDFARHPLVRRVIVIDNNSKDATSAVASAAGAIVVKEIEPGYGKCVFRALTEGSNQIDTDFTLLCEGDGTFSAFDIDKFMAYIPHSEIVNGTRIVEQLRDRETQLTTFMYYGNFAVGKMLELKHLGRGTFTDVGTTYKLCRNSTLARLLPKLQPDVNLEFNAHFLDTALKHGISLVECPVTFHKRIGVSKGGNTDNRKALKVGVRMIGGILFSWNLLISQPVNSHNRLPVAN